MENQETDIIVLLNYFKKGIKNFFSGIGNFFKSIIFAFLYLLILIKRYFIFVVGCIVIFGVIGYFNKDILPQSYTYEIIVQPNYNSTESLYNLVDSYKKQSELKNSKDPFFNALTAIKIEPIKSFSYDVDVFYNTIGNDFSQNNAFKQGDSRDTIFFRQYKIKDFQKDIKPEDYPIQKIILKTNTVLNYKSIDNKFTQPFESDPFYINYKKAILSSIDLQTKNYSNNLNKIDTLLVALADGKATRSETNSISLKGEAKNNLEDDLLKRSIELTGSISSLQVKKALYSDIIKVLSSAKLVQGNSKIERGTIPFAFYGFIFSFLIILLIQLYKYLNKFEKERNI